MVNVWAIGRDPNVWHDPLSFTPERFMGSNIDVKGHNFQLLPFSSGRRGCPGMQLGLTVVKLVVAQLVHCFQWELPQGMLPTDMDMSEHFAVVTARANHLKNYGISNVMKNIQTILIPFNTINQYYNIKIPKSTYPNRKGRWESEGAAAVQGRSLGRWRLERDGWREAPKREGELGRRRFGLGRWKWAALVAGGHGWRKTAGRREGDGRPGVRGGRRERGSLDGGDSDWARWKGAVLVAGGRGWRRAAGRRERDGRPGVRGGRRERVSLGGGDSDWARWKGAALVAGGRGWRRVAGCRERDGQLGAVRETGGLGCAVGRGWRPEGGGGRFRVRAEAVL
ncbi:hypothetical protein ACS0TY_025479 [Phlomoides rotata]